MTQVPMWQRWWVQALLAGVVATLIPVLTHKLEWTRTLPEDIVLGVGVWIVSMIFQMAHTLNSIHVDRLEARHILEVINENDCLLLELQARLRDVASRRLNDRPNRVFLDYCRRNLEHSVNVVRRAAQHGELEVHDHHFDTIDTVLGAFDGCSDRTYRCVWLIEDSEDLFDEYWRQYMKSLVQLSREGAAAQRVRVRILFVAENEAQLKRASVKTIVGFVTAEAGFEHRIIGLDDYQSRLRDGRLHLDCIDFGVYGDHLLFRTTSYEPQAGVFSDQQTAISNYRAMHDAAMDAARTLRIPDAIPVSVSLEEFLNCDTVSGNAAKVREER